MLPVHNPIYHKHIEDLQKKKLSFQSKQIKMTTQRNVFANKSKFISIVLVDFKKPDSHKISLLKTKPRFSPCKNSKNSLIPINEIEKDEPVDEKKKKLEMRSQRQDSLITINIIEPITNQKRGKRRYKTIIIDKKKDGIANTPKISDSIEPLDSQSSSNIEKLINCNGGQIAKKFQSYDDLKLIDTSQKLRCINFLSDEKVFERRNVAKKPSWNGKSEEQSIKVMALFASTKKSFQRRASIQIDGIFPIQLPQQVQKEEAIQKDVVQEDGIKKDEKIIKQTSQVSEESLESIQSVNTSKELQLMKKEQPLSGYKKILSQNRITFEQMLFSKKLKLSKSISQFVIKKNINAYKSSAPSKILLNISSQTKQIEVDKGKLYSQTSNKELEKVYGEQQSVHKSKSMHQIKQMLKQSCLSKNQINLKTLNSPYSTSMNTPHQKHRSVIIKKFT